jgi:redox-sensitive bicupin YhaK (pirin superfamily)
MVTGEILVNSQQSLKTSDGLAVSEESKLQMKAKSDSEIILFDLA